MTTLTTPARAVGSPGDVDPSGPRCACCRRRLERPKARRLTILDGAVLVAATGLALAIARGAVGAARTTGEAALVLIPALLTCATAAVLALRLRRPRPDLRRLTRQPGAVAVLAASAALAVGALPIAAAAIVRLVRMSQASPAVVLGAVSVPVSGFEPGWATWLTGPLFHLTRLVGVAVLGAWIVLALSGRRRPEASWIDALGRLLGAFWIAAFVVHLFFEMIGRYRF